MKSYQNILGLVAVLLVSLGFGAIQITDPEEPAQYTKEDVALQKYNWRGTVPKKNRIKVINRYGDISTRNTNAHSIELSGVIQMVGNDAPEPKVDIRNIDDMTIIEILYEKATVDSFGNRVARFDLGVYAPKGVFIEMETDFGDIKAKKHESNLLARTRSGKIKLASRATINATSDTGEITVNLLNWKSDRFVAKSKKRSYGIFSSRGNIDLYFDGDASLVVNANAGNGVETNDEVPSGTRILSTKKHRVFNSTYGKGERVLRATTQQGKIRLHVNRLSGTNSTVSPPISTDIDVRNLPKVNEWKPGGPVKEIEDGRSDRKKTHKSKIESKPKLNH